MLQEEGIDKDEVDYSLYILTSLLGWQSRGDVIG